MLIVQFGELNTLNTSAMPSSATRPGSGTRCCDAQVDTTASRLREAVAGHDGAIRAEPLPAKRLRAGAAAEPAQVAAVDGCGPFPDAGVEEAAQLEAAADLPDTVEHGPVTQVGGAEREVTAEIRRGDWSPGPDPLCGSASMSQRPDSV